MAKLSTMPYHIIILKQERELCIPLSLFVEDASVADKPAFLTFGCIVVINDYVMTTAFWTNHNYNV